MDGNNHYCETEADLANAYAGAFNKFFWLDDELYDDDVTQEEIKSCKEWKRLCTQLEEKIMRVLKNENSNVDLGVVELQLKINQFREDLPGESEHDNWCYMDFAVMHNGVNIYHNCKNIP